MSGPHPESSREGSALVMVLVVLIIVTGLCTVSLQNAQALMRISQRQVFMEQAHYTAEAGVEEAARRINSTAYLGGGVNETSITLPNGSTASVRIIPLNNRGKEFSVESTSTIEGVTRQVNIGRIYRPTYLEYGHFYEDFRNLWWIYGDIIDGKVWSGTRQNIYGYTRRNGEKWGPVFRGLNETSASSFGGYPDYAATLDDSIDSGNMSYSDLKFWSDHDEGYETNVSKPSLLDVDFDESKLIAQSLNVNPDAIDPDRVTLENMPTGKALKLKGKTEIRFTVETRNGKDVGIAEIRNRNAFGNFKWNPVYSESIDMIYVENLTTGPRGHRGSKVTLGDSVHHTPNVLKGSMTIWAEDDVTIPTHVIYHNQNLEESTDSIGVISKDDIWFDRKFSGDLVVQGGYIATGINNTGELGLIDYNKFGVRGTLFFTGSMVAERVYPFGVFNGDTFVSGFQTESVFDTRFATTPPPFTPVIDSEVRYEGWY